jgi:chromosome condensin MukBEF ATPase and DNA-binding subunit MukB
MAQESISVRSHRRDQYKIGSVTIPEVRDDAQLILLPAISAVGNSIRHLFVSKLKTFEETLLAAQKLYAGHDYVIQSAPKTFMTEFLFINWLEKIFLSCISERRIKFTYDGSSPFVLYGHSTHLTA